MCIHLPFASVPRRSLLTIVNVYTGLRNINKTYYDETSHDPAVTVINQTFLFVTPTHLMHNVH